MGIDKSNVRYVIHATMPKSLEGYQQESGRAGRDGLEAECCLLYSGGDYGRWKAILEKDEEEPTPGVWQSLQAMLDYSSGVICRHRALVAHFGQQLAQENCGACDVCLGDLDLVDDPLTLGQKILSSVIRQQERFASTRAFDKRQAPRKELHSLFASLKVVTEAVCLFEWVVSR